MEHDANIPAPLLEQGLSADAVEKRIAAGNVNTDATIQTRSVGQIIRANVCTLFNFVNVILALCVAITGSFKNMLFMLVIIINACIGIVQEIRSKRLTDKLAIVVASKAEVIRNGALTNIPVDHIVLDDIIKLGRGDQVPADCTVVEGTCKTDESLLTGESKPVPKKEGDELLSGSFLESGTVYARVIHVGTDNFAARMTAEAKQHKAINSEIMIGVNAIIKYVSIALLPLGLLLFASQFFWQRIAWDSAVLSTVSALVGMIPEGLILLTSTVLAVAVIRLSKYNVLVQQLYCIETLARVNVLCLDKTGTITTGNMAVTAVVPVEGDGESEASLDSLFASLAAADEDPNDTASAIQRFYRENPARVGAIRPAKRVIPFSSEAKYSGAVFDTNDAYVMGAAQFVLSSEPEKLTHIQNQLDALTALSRVLLLARVDGFTQSGLIEGGVQPLGFICIEDEIRKTAPQTIKYFIEQGVTLKVISGDDPHTVSGIAQKAGIPGADKFIDATELTTPEQIEHAITTYSVFGRVKPDQKKAFVKALQSEGNTVAMTGDGVNDVLALKSADCSVAMASGADAARNVAQLVLVDNDFASMPHVVAEGRRSINNLQRSASLFLVKTLLSISAAILFIILPWQYPFEPIQMTLVSAFTIGLPSFVLALEQNHDLVRGHFLANCIVRSIPGAICGLVSIIVMCAIGYLALGLEYKQVSTLCVFTLSFIGMLLIIRLSIPFNVLRGALLVVVVGGTILCATLFHNLFDIAPFTMSMAVMLACVCVANAVVFQILYNVITDRYRRYTSNPDERIRLV